MLASFSFMRELECSMGDHYGEFAWYLMPETHLAGASEQLCVIACMAEPKLCLRANASLEL